MKVAIHIICFAVVGFPAVIFGYAYKMAKECFVTGADIHDDHFDASYEKFCGKKE